MTAREILNQELWDGAKKVVGALKAANSFTGQINESQQSELEENWYDWLKEFTEKREREIADKAWEAGVKHGFDPERHYSTVEAKAECFAELFPETKPVHSEDI